MNIKQAAEQSGVSARNIRYYEQAGLLTPARNPENEYRIYSQADVRALKLIRMLRTLDMPVGDRTAAELDVDSCLERMDSPAPAGGWFTGWVQDYRKMAAAEHKRQFTFTSDTAIVTPQEFTAELLAWAANCGEEIVITHEGMTPRFTRPCGIRVMCAISRSCGCGARCAIHRRWRWRATRSGCGCRDCCTTACRCLYALHWRWSGSAPGICRFGPTRRLCCWCWALSASDTASAGGISITTTGINKKREAARAVSHLIYPSSSLCSSSTVSARAAAPAVVSSPAVP